MQCEPAATQVDAASARGTLRLVRSRRRLSAPPVPRESRAVGFKALRGGGATAVVVAALLLAGCGSSKSSAPPETSPPVSDRPSLVLYRTPTCGCCKSYEAYLRKHAFNVESRVLDDLKAVRVENAVPSGAASCHTAVVDGYAVEGHVPVEAIDMMLADRPAIDGIAVPGMPGNVPGMGGPDGTPIEVVSFLGGNVLPFTTL